MFISSWRKCLGDFPSARHPALHTVSVWIPVKPHWPFAGEHSVTLLALCEIWVRNTAASTAPSCPKLLPSIQPAGHMDPSGQGARMAEGIPCEGFRRGEHPSCFPLVNTRPWHHWALPPAPLQLQLCCHGPGPAAPSHASKAPPTAQPLFPWPCCGCQATPSSSPSMDCCMGWAELWQNVRGSSFQLGTIPFSWALSMNVLLSHVPRQQLLHSPALDGSACSKPYHWGNLFLLWKVRMKLPKLSSLEG